MRTVFEFRKWILGIVLVPLSIPSGRSQVRAVIPPQAHPNGVLSPAVDAGDYLYISAQGPRRPDGSLPGTYREQVLQALDNIKNIVESAGLGMDHVVYTQVYLQDISQYEEMDRSFGEYFGKNLPARAVLGVARVPDPPLQINAVAVRDMTGLRRITPPTFHFQELAAPAILTHDRLFISGMEGSEIETGKIPADPAAQVDAALDRMHLVLKAAGLDYGNMVFVNPYLTTEIPGRVMNQHYARRFEFGNTPARATIEVADLPHGAHIEYTGVAVRDIAQRKAVRPKNMPPSPTASPCVFAGNTLFCSAKDGFIPGPHGGIFATTTQHQLRQTMRNQLDNLEEADMTFDEVVSTTVYLDDLSDLAAFNEVYRQYFGDIPPARTDLQQIAPTTRKADNEGQFPGLEQVSLIAVRKPASK